MSTDWLVSLTACVAAQPIVVLRFGGAELQHLRDARRGPSEFSMAYPHDEVSRVKPPRVCIVECADGLADELWIGVIQSRQAISTLQTRLKVVRGVKITPTSLSELSAELTDDVYARNLMRRVQTESAVVLLSPKLSAHVIEWLAKIEANRIALRGIWRHLAVATRFSGPAALQNDAVQTALKAFGFDLLDDVVAVEIAHDRETALNHVWVHEDSVIEHDARSIPGFEMVGSDMTGTAYFQKGNVRLEIITANKRPLEEVFGVDLILFNVTHGNVVMIQYKMLERLVEKDRTDWIYRPDSQMEKELARIGIFSKNVTVVSDDYRLNPNVFYLKFVKRDASVKSRAVITPLEHFNILRKDPSARGPRNGFRISYASLGGRYLRETAFLDLVSAGYIGGHLETSAQLRPIVDAVLAGNRSLVAAIKTGRPEPDASIENEYGLEDEA